MRTPWIVLLGTGLAAMTGCCAPAGYQAAYVGRPLPCNHCAPNTTVPLTYSPAPNATTLPPGAVFGPPTIPNVGSNFTPPTPPPSAPAADPPYSRFNGDSGGRLYPPVPVNPAPDNPPTAKLLPPQREPQPTAPPPLAKPTEEPPALPADIPSFAIVHKGVAAGQRPFPEGVNWLKEHGYKTVLHIRPPTQTDTSAKRMFEVRGITYINLEVSSTTLTKDLVIRFNQVVADEKNRPLFVYDEDSTLVGALWYLYFRTAEGLSDEKARAEASRLGFKQDQDDRSRDMWIAVQNYLRSQNP